jgi:large subunit ribosomal protein L4
MASTDLYNAKAEKVGEVELPAALFGGRISPALLHEVATAAASNARVGTRAHKTRGAVSGGGKKPFKQKGTGRARQGSTRAPHWRHGGTVFGPLPRDYDTRVPQTKRRAALRAALAWKLQDGGVHVVDEIPAGEGRTKALAAWLAAAGWREGGALLVHAAEGDLLLRAGRNLPDVRVVRAGGVALGDLVGLRHLVVTPAALAAMEGLWAR